VFEETPFSLKPVHGKLGPAFRQSAKEIVSFLKSADGERVKEIADAIGKDGYRHRLDSGDEVILTREHVEVIMRVLSHGHDVDLIEVEGATVAIGKHS
jgi:hypothetical protein